MAFYSAEEAHAERAVQALKHSGKACILRAGTGRLTPLCARYRSLQLEGETLVVIETGIGRIEAVVTTLRRQGSPAIFAVRPDFRRELAGDHVHCDAGVA